MAELLPPDWLDRSLVELACLTPIHWLDWPQFSSLGLHIGLRRDDIFHPILGGNKFYKLHGHLNAARHAGMQHIVSFGGAYSNHIYALAAAGQQLGWRTTGIIRGEEPIALSPTLRDARHFGMHLIFVSRSDYKRRDDDDYRKTLERQLGSCYWVPEGAGDFEGARACQAIGEAINLSKEQVDVVCTPCGTGATMAGLVTALPSSTRAVGYAVLKGEARGTASLQERITQMVEQLGGARTAWCLQKGYTCGGYAKFPQYLAQFMEDFEQQTHIALDPVYTAKMLWGIWSMALNGAWQEGERIVALHTGGLQGRRGFHLATKDF